MQIGVTIRRNIKVVEKVFAKPSQANRERDALTRKLGNLSYSSLYQLQDDGSGRSNGFYFHSQTEWTTTVPLDK